MLQFKTVEPITLSVLRTLMNLPELQNFALVGGTALALKYGHRLSIDLDLFSTIPFENNKILDILKKEFGNKLAIESSTAKWGIFCYVEDIKVDIVYYPHPLIDKLEVEDGIRLYSSADIVGMKINAILGRGKKKDFWDLYELLEHYSLEEIIDLHRKKFPDQNLLITIPQSIIYFVDAEESEDPVSLKGQTWDLVKKRIQEKVRNYLA